MLDKEMDEYVTRVENNAYELGISVGKHQERERIIELLERAVMTVNMEWIVALIKEENDGGINN